MGSQFPDKILIGDEAALSTEQADAEKRPSLFELWIVSALDELGSYLLVEHGDVVLEGV